MTKHRLFIVLLLVGLTSLCLTNRANADGLLLINGVYRQPLSSHINVVVKDKIATTVLEQTFHNNLDKEVSATYIAPIPEKATVTSFAELVDGKWVEASIKASEQAKKDFATAVSKGQDAAIASAATSVPVKGQLPQFTFQIQIFLPPNVNRSVRLTYTQVLDGEVGLTRYTYPLSSSNLTDEKVGDLLITIKISDSNEIRAVYSPSHKNGVEVSRPDKNNAEVSYHAQNVSPAQDFEVIYTQSNDKFGLNVASYREKDDEDGFFVLVAAPQLEAKTDEVIKKDYVFVLDCSGSMQGHKSQQAKAALTRILDTLNPGDRFSVIAFSDMVRHYSSALLALDKRSDAQSWGNNAPVGGGTNIDSALLTALKTADGEQQSRPHIIVFLTDGQATVGVTNTQNILDDVRAANRAGSRIYTIGIGDVNPSLLNSLAQNNRGSSLFVSDSEDLTNPLRDFHATINNPVLVDLTLDFGNADVYDVYPNPLPDMFLGSQVVVTGRYRKGGVNNVTLKGNIDGEKYSAIYKDIKFIDKAEDSKSYSFVSRLWAQRKVDALLRKLQTSGSDPAIVEEVRQLGLRYNIITPYTSFVALPKTGLPLLYTDDYRTINTALITVGAVFILVGCLGIVAGRLLKRTFHA